MARVTKGKSLSSPELQPGWTIEDDGYGLLTCSAVFKVSHGTSTGTPAKGDAALKKAPARGEAFPLDGRLHCHRSSSSMDGNGIQTISADYVGIAAGTRTTPQVGGRFSSNQEPISTHPKFSVQIGGTAASPQNGAVFNEDGSFKRFADPSKDKFYGITSYLACGFGITGHFYSSDASVLSSLKSAVGSTSGTGSWSGINLLGGLQGLQSGYVNKEAGVTTIVGPSDANGPTYIEVEQNQLLLTGVAVEYYGKLLKISYDIMYSQDGWNGSIYNDRSTNKPSSDSKGSSWDGKGTLGLGAAFNARGAATSAFGT